MIYDDLETFKQYLRSQEKRDNTIAQYDRFITEFIEQTQIQDKADITKDLLIDYKENYLKGKIKDTKTGKQKDRYTLATINIKILILNKFITFLDLPKELKLKQEKRQKQTTLENVLTFKEYEHLREYAKEHNQEQLYYLMGTLEGTRHQNKRATIHHT